MSEADTLTRHLRGDVKEVRGCLRRFQYPAEAIRSSFWTVSPETEYRYNDKEVFFILIEEAGQLKNILTLCIFLAKRHVRKCAAIRSKYSFPFLEGKDAAVLWFILGRYATGNASVIYYLCFK